MSSRMPIPWVAAVIIGATIGAGLVVYSPLLAFAPFAFIAILGMLRSPAGRLALYVLGGLFAMGGTSGISAPKLAYLGLVLVVFAISFVEVVGAEEDKLAPRVRKLVLASSAWIAAAATFATAVGAISGSELMLLAQDAFGYVLLAAAPIIGAATALSCSLRSLHRVFVAAGLVAAVGWAVLWLARRGSGFGALERLTLGTAHVGFAAFAVALAAAASAPTGRRLAWGLLAAAIPVIYIASGSRSMVVFVLGLLGVLGARRLGRVPAGRFVAMVAVLGVVAFAMFTQFVDLIPDGDRILERFTRTLDAIAGGGDLSSDGSYSDRTDAYSLTLDAFFARPVSGQGLGYIYPSLRASGSGGLTLDSPFLLLSKFGLVGALMLSISAIGLWRLSSRRVTGDYLTQTTFRVFGAIALGRLFFQSPTEDKGLAYAIALLVALALVAHRDGGMGQISRPTRTKVSDEQSRPLRSVS